MLRRFFGRGSRAIDNLLGLRVRKHEQFSGIKPQRLAQPIDQRYGWLALTVLNVCDVAGLNADSVAKVTLRHARPIAASLTIEPRVRLDILNPPPTNLVGRPYRSW